MIGQWVIWSLGHLPDTLDIDIGRLTFDIEKPRLVVDRHHLFAYIEHD